MPLIRTGRPATLAPNGIVTSPHSLASAAGVDVLRAGGSAIDAAIATSAALSVLYPHMTGVGGDAFWLIWDATEGRQHALNGSGRSAAAIDARSDAQSITFSPCARPRCRFPMLTTGKPKLAASMMPLEEFPTIAAAILINEKYVCSPRFFTAATFFRPAE